MRIRAMHPYAFRSGSWAELVIIVRARGRACFLVSFADGATDLWPCGDLVAEYEFAS